MVKRPPASAGHLVSIPGSRRSPGGGHGNPLQCSCLDNPTDRGSIGLQRFIHDRSNLARTYVLGMQGSLQCGLNLMCC